MQTTSPRGDLVQAPWALEPSAVAAGLGSGRDGLAEDEAARRLALRRNTLPQPRPPSLATLVLEQLRDTFVLILLAAALVSVVARDGADAAVIGLVVVVNTTLGVLQQRKAQRAVDALRSLTVPHARVVRAGRSLVLPAEEVVEGDVVLVEAGDQVPADARLLEASDLWADEALLTGESAPVEKRVAPVEPEAAVPDRSSLVHGGTLVTRGRGVAVVVATGSSSEVGKLAGLLATVSPPPTPLQRRLARFALQVAAVVTALCLVVLVVGLLHGEPLLTMTLAAVSLAVAAIPESLPAVVAVSLALAARRMAQRSAVVRTLPAVESLGSVTVIASDKTGTLTEGRLSARELWTPAASSRHQLLEAVALCNDAEQVLEGSERVVVGDPLDRALLAAADEGGVDTRALRAAARRVAEVPFEHLRSRMTTVHTLPDGLFRLVCKGAPEAVLALVPHGADEARAAADRLAEQGLRVIAVGMRSLDVEPRDLERAEEGLELVGLVGLQDPPRAGAAAAVESCARAGVVPVMVTGDHPATAAAVARELGILVEGTEVVTGSQLASGSLVDARRSRVFARTAPEQKLGIVDRLREAGHVVAMTGDGVNDAPALRRADVGVAMGRSGSDVARQAADIVLLDDDFATIVAAVEEGRRVADNIRRFLVYGLSGGTAEVLVMLVGPLLGMPLPLLPAQVLWVNLLTHGLPGVALGSERGERDALLRAPRDPAAGVLDAGAAWGVSMAGTLMAAVALAVALVGRHVGAPWQSMVVVTLTLQQLLLALSLRSMQRSFVAVGVRGNPMLLWAVLANVVLLLLAVGWAPLMSMLGTRSLSVVELGWCLAASALTPVAVELAKVVRARRTRSSS